MDNFDKLIREIEKKPNWGAKELVPKISSLKDTIHSHLEKEGQLTVVKGKITHVDTIKKYDVIYVPTVGMPHFVMVHRVTHDRVIGVIFSSKDKTHSIHQIKNDRFFKGSYATNTYITIQLEDAYASFVRVFEDKKEADEIFSKIKQYFTSLFNPKMKNYRSSITKQVVKIPAPIVEVKPTVNETVTRDTESVQP